jgi:hypothetical protein
MGIEASPRRTPGQLAAGRRGECVIPDFVRGLGRPTTRPAVPGTKVESHERGATGHSASGPASPQVALAQGRTAAAHEPVEVWGSPPRGRGRRPIRNAEAPRAGLTPAQAGTTPSATVPPPPAWADPRAGGGDGFDWVTSNYVPGSPRAGGDDWPGGRVGPTPRGSPPRRRGRLTGDDVPPRTRGLTPAQAGTTHRRPARRGGPQAHPRAGGDDPGPGTGLGDTEGSPPRRRGRQGGDELITPLNGLTPAQAGTTPRSRHCCSMPGAHPRAGGDDVVVVGQPARVGGSPPRRRGRPDGGVAVGTTTGLTPAQAGTTAVRPDDTDEQTAHPRAGGDDPW